MSFRNKWKLLTRNQAKKLQPHYSSGQKRSLNHQKRGWKAQAQETAPSQPGPETAVRPRETSLKPVGAEQPGETTERRTPTDQQQIRVESPGNQRGSQQSWALQRLAL